VLLLRVLFLCELIAQRIRGNVDTFDHPARLPGFVEVDLAALHTLKALQETD